MPSQRYKIYPLWKRLGPPTPIIFFFTTGFGGECKTLNTDRFSLCIKETRKTLSYSSSNSLTHTLCLNPPVSNATLITDASAIQQCFKSAPTLINVSHTWSLAFYLKSIFFPWLGQSDLLQNVSEQFSHSVCLVHSYTLLLRNKWFKRLFR